MLSAKTSMISSNKSVLNKKKKKILDFCHKERKKGKKSKQCVEEGNLINVFEFQIDDMAH